MGVMDPDDPPRAAGASPAGEAVSVDERVPGLGVVAGPLGEPEVPLGVFLPRVRLQERVLLGGSWLDLAPVTVEHDLTAVDELPRPRHGVRVHRVGSHESILPGRDTLRVTRPGPLRRANEVVSQSARLRNPPFAAVRDALADGTWVRGHISAEGRLVKPVAEPEISL